MSLDIGLSTPLVVQMPGGFSPWETAATPDDLVAVATAADELGYHHLTCSEHVAVPTPVAAERGGVYYDPLATLSYLAATTRRIRLATSVLVLGYHHPLALAKQYGTLDVLSGGRVVLGVGVGSLAGEFELLGAEFEQRGAIADDRLAALRTALSSSTPTHDGPHVSYHDVVVEPHAVQPRVPIWVGGRTARSLRRAITLGDGWMPFGLSPETLGSMLRAVDIPDDFEVVLSPPRPLDPLGDPEHASEALGLLRGSGATVVQVSLAATGLAHYLEQLEAARSLADELD